MLPVVDCRSPPSALHSRLHCATNNSQMLPKDNVLNMSPRPSHHLNNPAAHLERTIFDQSSICWESEKEQSVDSVTCCLLPNGTPASKSSIELMKEIAMIEVEIMHMERYLLSLYRTAFRQHLPALLGSSGISSQCKMESPLQNTAGQSYYKIEHDILKGDIDLHDQVSRSCVLAGLHDQIEAASKSSSRRERKSIGTGHRSLADHLGASRMDDALNCPDKLSEQIVRCISSIYCRLANPSPTQKGFLASSSSSTSSSSTFSPRNLSGSWSPHCNEEGTRDCEFEGLKDESGPYALMTEVLKICLDDDSFKYAAITLQKFRSLVKGLEKVDPMKMKREEKLAFWINIHNALVMHAYLAYGTHNYVRNASILKAAYNVGGHCINAYDIQYSILGIRTHYSAPWLQTLLSPGKKFMAGSIKHAYAIEYPEPLVHFALCSGAYCDPAVRVYTAKNVFQDLKVAKEEFIQSSVYLHKGTKIYLPKILSYFAKDMSLNMAGLLEIVIGCLPEVQQRAIRTCLKGRPEKYVYWLPRNSTFRYLIHKEVAQVGAYH